MRHIRLFTRVVAGCIVGRWRFAVRQAHPDLPVDGCRYSGMTLLSEEEEAVSHAMTVV